MFINIFGWEWVIFEFRYFRLNFKKALRSFSVSTENWSSQLLIQIATITMLAEKRPPRSDDSSLRTNPK